MNAAAVAAGFGLLAMGFVFMSLAGKADDPADARKSRLASGLLFVAAIVVFAVALVSFFSSKPQGAM